MIVFGTAASHPGRFTHTGLSMNLKAGRVTPCAPLRFETMPARWDRRALPTLGSWPRFTSEFWKCPLSMNHRSRFGGTSQRVLSANVHRNRFGASTLGLVSRVPPKVHGPNARHAALEASHKPTHPFLSHRLGYSFNVAALVRAWVTSVRFRDETSPERASCKRFLRISHRHRRLR